MRFSKFIFPLVVGLAFLAGIVTHKIMQRYGISLRNTLGIVDSAALVRNNIIKRRTSSQYVAIRDFFEAYPGHSDVIMFGGSRIAFADWALLLGRPVSNRGIYGDTTESALLRINPIIAAHAKCVVTMLGIGDFAAGRSVESTFSDYAAIIDRLTKSGTTVLVQSTLPSEAPYTLGPLVKDLNLRLRKSCKDRCLFLDLDNLAKPGWTIDGAHLKPATYAKWAEELKPVVAANCGASR